MNYVSLRIAAFFVCVFAVSVRAADMCEQQLFQNETMQEDPIDHGTHCARAIGYVSGGEYGLCQLQIAIDLKLIDPNLTDQAGDSLLHHAVRSRSIEAIKILLKKGASVHAQDSSGLTPEQLLGLCDDEKSQSICTCLKLSARL